MRRRTADLGLQLYSRASAWWPRLRGAADQEAGATAVEYALMVALIALVIIAAVTLLGQNTGSKFSTVATAVGGA